MEKTLQKKLNELNSLKSLLISREGANQKELVDNIKYIMEDIDLALSDFGYINNKYRIQEYTLEEVAKYNGENGGQAWVIINGNIYDASKIEKWKGGIHFGVKAGQDVTEYFKTCHNSDEKIKAKLSFVGKLKQE